ncbi:MAG: tetratricopeptide repeat protein [Lysobacterales bacterium]
MIQAPGPATPDGSVSGAAAPSGAGLQASGESRRASAPAGADLAALDVEALRQLDAALERLLELEAAARVDALAAQPAALQPALRQLLAAAEQLQPERTAAPLQLLHALAQAPEALDLQAQATADTAVQQAGEWRLLAELGRGGMGSVHLGERRSHGFVLQAAVKRLHAGIDSREFLRRFERERRILAELSHPGIARLIDGGEDAEGRPYLVMERVEGEPIDRYCDSARLDLGARVALCLQVLDALAHAHRSGVLHRDIKPSNLLVDASGRPHLLDFGIAKSLQGAADEQATATALRLLTPQYASPEQLLGQPMGVAADLYQMGLLLYLLLSGCQAQQPTDPSPAALQRAVCEQLPLPPSQHFAEGEDLQRRAEARGASPKALRRRLRGDLDRIVLMCLRKEPQARYADADSLAEDLRRWQRGLPVRARSPSFAYRLRRLVARHPLESAVLGLLAAVLVLFALQQREQALALAAERDHAAAQALRAERVKAMLLQLLAQADPERSGVADLSVREVLARGLEPLEAELAADPPLGFDLRLTVADAQLGLGLPDEAWQQLESAASLLAEALRTPVQQQRWQLLAGRTQAELGATDEARRWLRAAARLPQAASAEQRELQWEARKALGWAELWTGEIEAADTQFSALLAEVEASTPPGLPLASALNSLGAARRAAGRLDEATELLQRSQALFARLLPAGHPELLHVSNNLAVLHRSRGDEAAAEALYRRVLDDSRQGRGRLHPGTATVMNNLARLLKSQGRLDESLALLREALDIRRQRLGDRHVLVAMTHSDIGWVLHDQGALDAAEQQYRSALDLYPPGHAWRSATVFNLGRVHEARGALEPAERHYREALEAQRHQYGPLHERVGIDHLHLGIVLRKRGRLSEADGQLDQAEKVFAAALPESHDRFAQLWLAQADLAEAQGDRAAARALLQRALDLRERTLGADDARTQAVRERFR